MPLFKFGKKTIEGEKKSYSQSGEDLIIRFVFDNYLKIPQPRYLDIGAHHPTYLSNTYLFYQSGASGICVEADPFLCENIRKVRPRDMCLNVGAAAHSGNAEFFIMTTKTLNTFSREEALRYQSYGNNKIEQTVQIPLLSIQEILKKHGDAPPNFISLDVEGLDLSILESFDFTSCRPEIFCIETLTYVEDKTERKLTDIIDFMISKNYFVYADTFLNTIFVAREAWDRR